MIRRSVLLDALIDVSVKRSVTVQHRLKYLLSEGLTQRDLSALLGVSEACMSLWLSGKRTPRGKQTHLLLDFLVRDLVFIQE